MANPQVFRVGLRLVKTSEVDVRERGKGEGRGESCWELSLLVR
jgi:hypothetical protein